MAVLKVVEVVAVVVVVKVGVALHHWKGKGWEISIVTLES